eukprot:g5109.t1
MDRAPGRARLSVNTGGVDTSSFDLHTHADNRGDALRTGGLEIHSSGVIQDGAEHHFSVMYEDLEIAEVIGRGCSSFVLRARHVSTNKPLALKVINMFDKGKRHQLINEIKALYNASHPNVIHFLGAFYREGAVTIVTEYMDGGSLLNVLQQVGAIPESALSSVAYQVLLALAYLRREKRVHRDIKPSNLLINSHGVVKDETTAIDLIQTIVDAPAPMLDPTRFSRDLCRFVADCLKKSPDDRIPAQALLGAPWVTGGGANADLGSAAANVKRWIDSL